MKLSITDWQQSANARVLPGVINALDTATNTATVAIATGQIVGVPIHYWCNHGVDNHGASRVFRVGDAVRVLYLGNTSAPSASNLTILGLAGEIRRCRTLWNLMGALNRADGTPSGTALAQFGFLGATVQQDTDQIMGGSNWWTDGTRTLSWAITQPNRYCRGSNAGGTSVYMDGALLATTPVAVAGAALQGDDLLIFSSVGDVWRRSAADGSWTRIYQWSAAYGPQVAISVNADCTKASTIIDGTLSSTPYCLLAEYSITGSAVSVTFTDQLHRSGLNWDKPVAVDYQGTTLVVATLYYTSTITQTETPGTSSVVFTSGTTVVYDNTGHVIDKSTDINVQLRYLTKTITLAQITTDETITTKTYEVNDSVSTTFYDYSSSDVMNRSVAYGNIVVGLDLRLNVVALYHQEFGPVTLKNNTSDRTITLGADPPSTMIVGPWSYSYGCSDIMTFTRWKEIESSTTTILDLRSNVSCALDHPADGNGGVYDYPIAPEAGFDTVDWVQGSSIWVGGTYDTTHWPISGYTLNLFAYASNEFKCAEKGIDRLVSWRTSYGATYLDYTGGDVATLAGVTGPLYAASLAVT